MRFIPLILPALLGCASSPDHRSPVEVLLFVTTDCPIANAFAPEINRIHDAYAPRGVDFTIVYVDPTLTEDVMLRHAKDYGFRAKCLLDARHELVRKHAATVTPEAVVIAGGARVYRGRIDDRYLAPGKYRIQPTTRELRDALDAALAGRPVAVAETNAAGCLIPTE